MTALRRWLARRFFRAAVACDPESEANVFVAVLDGEKVIAVGNETFAMYGTLSTDDVHAIQWALDAELWELEAIAPPLEPL